MYLLFKLTSITAVEGWHNSFSSNVGAHHANIWSFIEALKREEPLSLVTLTHIHQGHEQLSTVGLSKG